MTLLSADSFNRTNNATNLGSTNGAGTIDPHAWSAVVGVLGINSNQAAPNGAITHGVATVPLGTPDVDLSCVLSAVAANGGLSYRVRNSTNFWFTYATATAVTTVKNVAGSLTVKATTTVTVNTNAVLRVVAHSSTISVYLDGVLLHTVADPFLFDETDHGIYLANTSSPRVDSFSASSLPTGWTSVDVEIAWVDDPLEPSPTWSAIPKADVLGVETDRGWGQGQEVANVGTMDVSLDDRAGAYNPANASGPHYGQLTSYRQVRLLAIDSAGVPEEIFRGHVIPRGWQSEPLLPGTGRTTMKCADVQQMAGRYRLAKLDVAEDLGADIQVEGVWNHVLGPAYANFPGFWVDNLDPAGSTSALAVPSDYGEFLLAFGQKLAIADAAYLYANKSGILTFENRLNAFFDATRTTPQQTFADDGTGGAIPYEADSLVLGYAHDLLTGAEYTPSSGVPQTVVIPTPDTVSGLPNVDSEDVGIMAADAEAHARAELAVALRSGEIYSPVALTFEATESTIAFDALCHLDLRHRVRLKYTLPGMSTITEDAFATRIAVSIPSLSDPNTIKVTIGCDPTSPWDALTPSTFLILDDATHGKLGTDRLAP